jgi:hypothetical protein
MPETNLQGALLKIGLALAKHHIKNVIGNEALEVVADALADVGGEKVQAKADSIFASKGGQKELLKAIRAADKSFRKKCPDKDLHGLFTMNYGDLPSVQTAIAGLPEALDDETLRETLFTAFRNDAPKRISDEQLVEGVNLYVECLQSALIPVKDFGLRVIHNALREIGRDVKDIKANVKLFGDMLYKKFSDAPDISTHIHAATFKTLIDERTRDFVGREFVFTAIKRLLAGPNFPSGYIVIRGEPGIGKTSLISKLVKDHGYVHHFNIAAQNIRSPRDFLNNICAQLIVRYELDYALLPPEAEQDSGFLSQLLEKITVKYPRQQIVVLVDALDEAENLGLSPAANRLYLPPALPNGVYFVVTTREKADERFAVDRRQDIYLRDDDPLNYEDIRHYIRNFINAHQDQMTARIQYWGVIEDEFVNIITEKSLGNFMYLVYVLGDIRDGKLGAANVDNIRDLPQGLRDYYQRHWRIMKAQDTERFERYFEPVVCMLATVREPVTVSQLKAWTKLPSPRIVEVIREWHEFLHKDNALQDEERYWVYHTSFQDFLREEVGLTHYHNRIAQTALDKIRW